MPGTAAVTNVPAVTGCPETRCIVENPTRNEPDSETSRMLSRPSKLRIGLALGSGAARGWSHIGAIQVLEEAGIRPHTVGGTAVGGLGGGIDAEGMLEGFNAWVRNLRWSDVVSLWDFAMGGGLVK